MSCKLNVEVIIKTESLVKKNSLSGHIKDELIKRKILRIGSKITTFETDALRENVEAIHICECDVNGSGDASYEEGSTVLVENVNLNLHIYRLNNEPAAPELLDSESSSDTNAASLTLLPSAHFHGIWESLIFDTDIKKNLLQYARAMLHFSKAGVDGRLVASNRVVLLHGPPGTGKTSLSKGLAQRLAVRLSADYQQALLVEINTHGLFSKYFSESGKLVSRLFTKLAELASDKGTLVFILVDEVESLAHSRATFTGNEPSDAIRVVNALLTHLDMLKEFPNVMIFTTSNITGAIDIAFVDRADIRAYIPQPSPPAIYSIYHSCLQELLRVGMIVGTIPERFVDWKNFGSSGTLTELNGITLVNGGTTERTSVEQLLMQLARESVGLTGRSLRKVPLRVFSTQVCPEKIVRLDEYIAAMSEVVREMKAEQKEVNQTVSLQ